MIIDGNKIAEEIKKEITADLLTLGRALSLGIVYVGSDPVIDKFIRIKKKFGESIGVRVDVYNFAENISNDNLKIEIKKVEAVNDGVIVQLPLPKNFITKDILNSISEDKDIDVLSEKAFQDFIENKSEIFPPVAGAVKRILEEGRVDLNGKHILIVGKGQLVGLPVFYFFKNNGFEPDFIDKETPDIAPYVKKADIIVSGAGSPDLIKSTMIKDGAVLIDAGTSELSGKISGDIEASCADKASLFTPVPGGVGPVTVAILFKNLALLASEKKK